MPKNTKNPSGLSQNASGYYRRYLGKVRLEGGDLAPLHVTFSRNLDESRWMDGIWQEKRRELAEKSGVPVTAYVWPEEVANELKGIIGELLRLDREQLERDRRYQEEMRRELLRHHLNNRLGLEDQYARAGIPRSPVLAAAPPVATSAEAFDAGVKADALASMKGAGIVAENKEPGDSSLDAALTEYATMIKADPKLEAPTRRRSVSAVESFRVYAAALKPPLDLTAPMKEVSYGDLERLTNHVKGRPVSEKTDRPLAPNTVKTLCQKWRECLDWIDRNESRFGWVWPRRAEELFAVDLNAIMTKQERDDAQNGTNVIVPTYAELAAYVTEATDYQRMLILTAVFAALGQTELSSLRRNEFDLGANKVTHNRNKTCVKGVYYLPPELCKLIGKYWEATPADASRAAFLTSRRTPLVSGTSDSVRQWFDDLRATVTEKHKGVRRDLTFYDFRRVLANHPEVARHGLYDVALSQTHKTVSRKNYAPNRDEQHARLWVASQHLYAELKKAHVFAFAKAGKKQGGKSVASASPR